MVAVSEVEGSADVERLRPSVRGKLNLEMSTSEEMLKVALQTRPHQVTLVAERPAIGQHAGIARDKYEHLRGVGEAVVSKGKPRQRIVGNMVDEDEP